MYEMYSQQKDFFNQCDIELLTKTHLENGLTIVCEDGQAKYFYTEKEE